jgi:hypothetical protein
VNASSPSSCRSRTTRGPSRMVSLQAMARL